MTDAPDTRNSHLIAKVWQRSKPQVLERLTQLESAAAAAQQGALTETQRADAESIAHKLSGSLGMFGFPKGTDLARELEAGFKSSSPDPAALASLTQALRAELFPAAA